MIKNKEIVVVGAGIAGLTSAAILSKLGLSVTLIESHTQSGGCAGTFNRKGYIFDVGATQVAGLEAGGIHSRIFNFLEIPIPEATILDPSCIVDLNDGSELINIWYEKNKWSNERSMQFPGSEKFWSLCESIHINNWKFASQNSALPINNYWDFAQFIKAINPKNILSGILIKSSIFDLLKFCGCHLDERLIKFLNLQLKLYSQENVYNTAALYGCTILQMPQKPHGLYHLNKSMQTLSNALEESLRESKVNILFGEKVSALNFDYKNKYWQVTTNKGGERFEYFALDVIYTPPPQSLLNHLDDSLDIYRKYKRRLKNLPKPSGAIVFYSALQKAHMKNISAYHYQFIDAELGSLFVSLSAEGDGRAPNGEITLIASIFANTEKWFKLDSKQYSLKKRDYFEKISRALEDKFSIFPDKWLHRELATPLSFQRWTNRPMGIVGGLGQNVDIFGIFGLSSRTPIKGLWLCGDSVYPGEGTAGVSQSALIVSRQILASKGIYNFNL